MADEYQDLIDQIGGPSQVASEQAYERLVQQVTGQPTHDYTELVERITGTPQRGWVALGQRFYEGAQRNVQQLRATVPTLRAIGSELSGDPVSSALQNYEAEQLLADAPEGQWSLQDVRNPEDFAYWLAERFGENSLTLLASMFGAGSGALAANLGVRALGGTLAARRAAGLYGSILGGMATAVPMETAGTAQEQAEVTGTTQPHISIPAGIAKGLLEIQTPLAFLRAFRQAGLQLGSTLPRAIGHSAVREAVTEGLQESIDIGARVYQDPNYKVLGTAPDVLGPGAWRFLEAFVAGGAIGGVVGTPAAMLERRQERGRPDASGLLPGQQRQLDPSMPMNMFVPADPIKQQQAEALEAQGMSARAIHQQTGVFRGRDGNWREEVDVSQMQLRMAELPTVADRNTPEAYATELLRRNYGDVGQAKQELEQRLRNTEERVEELNARGQKHETLLPDIEFNRAAIKALVKLAPSVRPGAIMGAATYGGEEAPIFRGKLGVLLKAPELFKKVPGLAGLNITLGSATGLTSRGSLNPDDLSLSVATDTDRDEILDTFTHELQHAVQLLAKWERGGNTSILMGRTAVAMFEAKQQLKDLPAGSNVRGELERLIGEMEAQAKRMGQGISGFAVTTKEVDAYKRILGEVEARNAENRRKLSAAARAKSFPLDTEDVPAEEQFARGQLTSFKSKNEAVLERAVLEGWQSRSIWAEQISNSGNIPDAPYGISLMPSYGSNPPHYTQPAAIRGTRGGFHRMMNFTPDNVTEVALDYGVDALIEHIEQQIKYREDKARWIDTQPGYSRAQEEIGGLQQTAEWHRGLLSLLQEIKVKHPEFSRGAQYEVTPMDPEGVIEQYKGKIYTDEDINEIKEKMIAAAEQQVGKEITVDVEETAPDEYTPVKGPLEQGVFEDFAITLDQSGWEDARDSTAYDGIIEFLNEQHTGLVKEMELALETQLYEARRKAFGKSPDVQLASIRVWPRTGQQRLEEAREQGMPGPVAEVRQMVQPAPTQDRDLQESTVADPKEDFVGIGPLLNASLPPTTVEAHRDFVEANTPRYIVEMGDGTFSNTIYTDTDLEYFVINRMSQGQKPRVRLVQQDSLTVEGISAHWLDIPSPDQMDRVWYMDGTTEAEQVGINYDLLKLQQFLEQNKGDVLSSEVTYNLTEETVLGLYERLLNRGLRIIPSRGSSFYYLGGRPMVADPVDPPRTTGRANFWMYWLPNGTLSTGLGGVGALSTRTKRPSGMAADDVTAVTVDLNKFRPGEVSMLPYRSTKDDIITLNWSGHGLDQQRKADILEWKKRQDVLHARIAPHVPEVDGFWSQEGLAEMRKIMREGYYVAITQPGFDLITLEPVQRHQLTFGVNITDFSTVYATTPTYFYSGSPPEKTDFVVTIGQLGPNSHDVATRLKEIIQGLKPVVQKILNSIGLQQTWEVVLEDTSPQDWMAYVTASTPGSPIVFIPRNWISYKNQTSPKVFTAAVFMTLMHELGHLITRMYYQRLPVEVQQQLTYAYRKALLTRRVASRAELAARIAPLSYTGKEGVLAGEDYYITFAEWLAEQFRRYAEKSTPVNTELDRFYRDVADAMDSIYAATKQHAPALQHFNLHEPDYYFTAFMEYLRRHGDQANKFRQVERRQGLYAFDDDIINTPVLLDVANSVVDVMNEMKALFPPTHKFNIGVVQRIGDTYSIPGQTTQLTNKVVMELSIGALNMRPDRITQETREVIAHELIHVYRMLGFISKEELNTLYTAALREGRALDAILKAHYRKQVQDFGQKQGWSDERIEQEYATVLREETVAYYVGYYAKHGGAPTPAVQSLLDRILEFVKKLVAKLAGRGYQSSEELLQAFFRGEIARRGSAQLAQKEADQRFMLAIFQPLPMEGIRPIKVEEGLEARWTVEPGTDSNSAAGIFQFYPTGSADPVGQYTVQIRYNRGFQVDMSYSKLKGKHGVMLQFIEKTLKLPILAPQYFTKSGWRAAMRLYPELKDYYVSTGTSGDMVSARYIQDQLNTWHRIAADPNARHSGQLAQDQIEYWKAMNRKLPSDVWTRDKTALDKMFMLGRNYHLDGVYGSIQEDSLAAEDAQLGSLLGEAHNGATKMDSFTLAFRENMQHARRTAAEKLGVNMDEAAGPQPEVRHMRRILAWLDKTGATTHPAYLGNLKKANNSTMLSQEADRIWYFSKMYWSIQQLSWRNEHLHGLQKYKIATEQMHAVTTGWQGEADDIARMWDQLSSSARRDTFNRFMYWLADMKYRSATEVANDVIRHPTMAELTAEEARLGFTVPEQELRKQLYIHPDEAAAGLKKDIFGRFLDAVEAVSVANIQRTITDLVKQAQAIAIVQRDMNALREKPYFPVSRFGEHTITVRDGDPANNNRVLWFSAYDNHIERDKATEQVSKQFPLDRIHVGRMPEEYFEFMGLPGPLIRNIRDNIPNITPTQIAWLEELERNNLPDNSFRRRWIPGNKTPGKSMDAFRAFAHYFMHGSRYLARMQYRQELIGSIGAVEETLQWLPNGSKRRMIIDYMKAHYKYVMEGGKDWAKFKSFVSVWQLGFSPAAAFMNLTQTPLVSIPWLNGVFGSTKGTPQILKSMRAVRNLRRGYVTSGVGNYSVARQEMVRQGRIDIGQAAELGAFAEGNNLLGLIDGTKGQRAWRNTVYWSMKMFQSAEQVNREVMMHAAWELAHQQMANNKRLQEIELHHISELQELENRLSTPTKKFTRQDALAFVLAKEALDQTQGLYAPYARPRFMWSPAAGTLLIFHQFIQLMMYAFRYNPGAVQMWALYAFVYGVAGLPGAEELSELIRRAIQAVFGRDIDPKTEARKLIRQLTRNTIFDEIGPDLAIYGVSKYGFGVGVIPSIWGIAPFDASANGSMGKVLPFGVYELLRGINTSQTNEQMVSEVTQRALGAGWGWMLGLSQFFMQTPGTVDGHRWEQALPRTLRAFQAARRYSPPELGLGGSGAATLSSGAAITRFHATDPEDLAAIAWQAFGFRPTTVSRAQELRRELLDMERMYQARRGALFVQMGAASFHGNTEVIRTVVQAIRDYNEEVRKDGLGSLAITSQQVNQSLRSRARTRALQEQFLPNARTMIPAARGVQDRYPGVIEENVK